MATFAGWHLEWLTLAVAELPLHLLAKVLACSLEQLPRQMKFAASTASFRRASPRLTRAVQLATVSRLWRQAAVLAAADMHDLDTLCFDADLEAQELSPLLADLARGRHLVMRVPLLTMHTMPSFLDRARPRLLTAQGPEDASAAVAALLSGCTSLDALQTHSLKLASLPASLRTLDVDFHRLSWPEQQVAQVLHSLEGLHRLEMLTLRFQQSSVALGVPLPTLPALRQLEVHINASGLGSLGVYQLSALAAAAAVGARVVLSFVLTDSAEDWQRLCSSMAGLSVLDELRLVCPYAYEFVVTNATLHLHISPVRCAVLNMEVQTCVAAEHLLKKLECQVLHCLIRRLHFSQPLEWAMLSARPGIYIVDMGRLSVQGCDSQLPQVAGGWALVLLQPLRTSVTGVPLSQFAPGPGGHLVWRNSLVSDADLWVALAAFETD